MAFFASYLDVQTGERIARFRVIKILGRFPAVDVVALGAFVAELAFVRIVVTGRASRRKAEIGLRQIFILNEGFVGREHFGGRVAFIAG